MADIARLAIEVDPKDLQAAIKQLEKLSVEAGKAEVAAKKLERAEASAALAAARAAQVQASAAAVAARGNSSMTAAQKTAASETAKQANAALNAARAIDAQAAASLKAAQAAVQQSEAAQRIVASNQAAADSAQNLANVQDRTTRNMGRLAGQQQANMSNIAAQFQDIGVTAAMGMSPMMIGLQQGAQLTGVWGSVAGSTSQKLKTFAMSIGAVLSPMSLLIIALTTGIAYLIQWGIETFTVSKEMKSLEDAASSLTSIQSALGDMFDMTSGKIKNNSELVRINTFVTLMNAKAKAAALAAESGDLLNRAAGGKAPFLNFDFGVVMSGPEQAQQKQNLAAVSKVVRDYRSGAWKADEAAQIISGLDLSGTGYTMEELVKGLQGDVLSRKIEEDVQKAMESVDTGKLDPSFRQPGRTRTSTKKPEETQAEKFAKMMKEARQGLTELQQEYQMLNLVGEARYEYAAGIEMENKAKELGIDLSKEGRQAIVDSLATQIAAQQIQNDTLKYYQDEEKALKATGLELKIKANTIGMTAVEAEMYAFKQKILNDEIERGIKLSAEDKQSLIDRKFELVTINEELDKQKAAMDAAKGATRDFLGDMKSGLLQGQSLWQTWGNAVLRVIDTVINKLLDDLVNAMFKVNSQQGGGGLLGGLTSLFRGIGGSGMPSVSQLNASALDTMRSSISMPQGFANGGAFTNGIVHKPTAFFAKGGTPGVMGEAGPEAIVPLQRGPDGSLGVQMFGGAAQAAPAVVQIVPSEYFDVVVDDRAAKVAAPMVVQGAMAANKVNENTAARQQRRRLR